MRRLSILLSALAVVVLLLSACASDPAAADSEGAEAPAAASGVEVSVAGDFPIVEEPITIKAFVCPTNMIKDYKENEFTYWLEDLTGINLEFDVPAQADAQQKLNLMLASGDLPDVIIGCGIRLDQLQILADQGWCCSRRLHRRVWGRVQPGF